VYIKIFIDTEKLRTKQIISPTFLKKTPVKKKNDMVYMMIFVAMQSAENKITKKERLNLLFF
jgi:hypothetical protein